MFRRSIGTAIKRLQESTSVGNGLPRYARQQWRTQATTSRSASPSTGSTRLKSAWLFGLGAVTALVAGNSITYVQAEKPSSKSSQANFASTCPLQDMPRAVYNTTPDNLNAATQEFIQLLGAKRVDLDLGARISHSSTEWSAAPRGDLDRFDIIVSPQSTEEVSAIAKICHRRRIPMTAFSGGTSLEGTLAATQGGVCIDFKLMNNIITVRKSDLDVTVQPGVGYVDLNAQLASQGLYFPPDPGPGAQIGGMM